MRTSFLSAVSFVACTAVAASKNEFLHLGRLIPPIGESDEFQLATGAQANLIGSAFFKQLLDHDDPSKGTFQQKFWWNAQNWAGPGSPVVFFTPGEIAAAPYVDYLTNITLTGLLAQELKGAVIMVEHRFWGESSPYDDLTTENLQLLTLHQAVLDFVKIAKTVDLPFDTDHSSNADNAPWVFSGGSYSGALSAWTQSLANGTFWAYHASSAPVEAIDDYWQYFAPVQEGMPKNCSKDVSLVIDYMDNLLNHGTAEQILDLKTQFGLQALEHNDDFMSMLANGPYLWQSNSFYTGYSGFFKWCDAIENVTAGAVITPDENGVGLEVALAQYANWINTTVIPGYCQGYGYTDEYETACMNSYDPNNKIFTDYTVSNAVDRQWNWMLCNEPFDYWQDGAPRSRPTIVSRLITAEYWQRQCGLFFPTVNGYTYSSNASPDKNVHQTNKQTEGWRLDNTVRLIWTNGEFDPWRTSGVSSEFRPDGPLVSTPEHPVQIIPGGFHCSDLRLKNGQVNEGVQTVIDNEVKQIVAWVAEYPKK